MNIAPLISRTPPPISDVADQEDDDEDITVYPALQFCHQNDSSPEGVDKVIIDDTLPFGIEVQNDIAKTGDFKTIELNKTPGFHLESNGTNQITSDNHVDSIISCKSEVNHLQEDSNQSDEPIKLLDCKNIHEPGKPTDEPKDQVISNPLSNGSFNNCQEDKIEDLNLDQIKYDNFKVSSEVLENSFVPPLTGGNGDFGLLTENDKAFGLLTEINGDSRLLNENNREFGTIPQETRDFVPLTKDNGDFNLSTKDNVDFRPSTEDIGDFGILTCDNGDFAPLTDNNVEFGEFEESNYQSSLTVVNDVEINSTDCSNELLNRENLEIDSSFEIDENHEEVSSNVCRNNCVEECKCFNEIVCPQPLNTVDSLEFDDEIVFQSAEPSSDLKHHSSSPPPVNSDLVTKENSFKLIEQNTDSIVSTDIVSPSFEVSFPEVIEKVGLNEDINDFEDDEFSEFVECTYIPSAVSGNEGFKSTDPYEVFTEGFIEANISPVLLLCLKEEINKNSVWNKLSSLENTPAMSYKWNESFSSSRLLSSLRIDSRNILTGHWSRSFKKLPSYEYNSSNESSSSSSNINFSKTCVPHPQFEWNGSGLINPLDDPTSRHKKSSQHVPNLSNEAEKFISSFPDLSYLKQTFIVFPKNIN